MFKEIYKSANDDIKADDELLYKVLKQKRRKIPPVYKYSSIAAAVVVISAAVAAIPLMNGDKSGIIYEEVSISTAAPSGEKNAEQKADEPSKTQKDDDSAENTQSKDGENVSQKPNTGASAESAAKAKNTEAPKPAAVQTEESNSKEQETSYAENTAEQHEERDEIKSQSSEAQSSGYAAAPQAADADLSEEYQSYSLTDMEPVREYESEASRNEEAYEAAESEPDEEISEQKNVNTYTKSVVLHVNSEDYGVNYNTMSGTYEDYDAGGSYESVDWSMEDYFNYLGVNVFNKITLTEDFSYIGDYEMTVSLNEAGEPGFDSRIFPYSGSGERYVTVITSKNTLTAQTYLSDERYVKSDIDGNPAVIIGGGNYKCYIIGNGISYIITATGISEEELGNLLISIGG